MVTVYGSARVDSYAANRSVVTLEGGTARADNLVYVTGSSRNQSRRVLRPWARLAWDAGGNGVSAWYSGVSSQFISLTSGTSSRDDESVFHLEGRTSRPFHGDAGRVVVGASLQDNHVNTGGTILGPANDDRSDHYYGGFAQLEYAAGHVRLIAAARWDDSDLFPAQLSPKAALVFTPAKNHALRVTVNRAFLTPGLPSLFAVSGPGVQNLSAIETQLRADPSVGPALAAVPTGTLFTNSAAVPESAFGNPHLVPQAVTSYEIGYKGQFGRRVFITLDAYAAQIENFLTGSLPAGTTGLNPAFKPWAAPAEVPAASRAEVKAAVLSALAALDKKGTLSNGLTRLADGTTAIVLSFGNAGTVDERGVELGNSVQLTPALTFSASYTWYSFAIRHNLAGNVLAPNTPRHKGTVALAYSGPQGITLGVDVRIASQYHWSTGFWIGDIPASQIVNLNAGYRINPHLHIYADATDLFDQRRFQVYGGAVIGRRVLAGVTSTF
jgi:outer membrane receptor protein involved in Fe transport